MKRLTICILFTLMSVVGFSQTLTVTSDYAQLYENKELTSQGELSSKITFTKTSVTLNVGGDITVYEVLDIHEEGKLLHFAISGNKDTWTEEVVVDEANECIYLVNYETVTVIVFYNIRESKDDWKSI